MANSLALHINSSLPLCPGNPSAFCPPEISQCLLSTSHLAKTFFASQRQPSPEPLRQPPSKAALGQQEAGAFAASSWSVVSNALTAASQAVQSGYGAASSGIKTGMEQVRQHIFGQANIQNAPKQLQQCLWFEKKLLQHDSLKDFKRLDSMNVDTEKAEVDACFSYLNEWSPIGDYGVIYDDQKEDPSRFVNGWHGGSWGSKGKIYPWWDKEQTIKTTLLSDQGHRALEAKCQKMQADFNRDLKTFGPYYYASMNGMHIEHYFLKWVKNQEKWANSPEACKFERLRDRMGPSMEMPNLHDLLSGRERRERTELYLPTESIPQTGSEHLGPEFGEEVALRKYVHRLSEWYEKVQSNMGEAQKQLEAKNLPDWKDFEDFQVSLSPSKYKDPCWDFSPAEYGFHPPCVPGRIGDPEDCWEGGAYPAALEAHYKETARKLDGFLYRDAKIRCFPKDIRNAVPSVEDIVRWREEDYRIWKTFRKRIDDFAKEVGKEIVDEFEKCLKCRNKNIFNRDIDEFSYSVKKAENNNFESYVFLDWKEEFECFIYDNREKFAKYILDNPKPTELRYWGAPGGSNSYYDCFDESPRSDNPTENVPDPVIGGDNPTGNVQEPASDQVPDYSKWLVGAGAALLGGVLYKLGNKAKPIAEPTARARIETEEAVKNSEEPISTKDQRAIQTSDGDEPDFFS
jgi:hypothetical protein